MWGCEDVDQQMWRCEDVDQQMWGCEDVDQQMWRCEDVDQQVWGCEDVLQRLLFYEEPFAGALGIMKNGNYFYSTFTFNGQLVIVLDIDSSLQILFTSSPVPGTRHCPKWWRLNLRGISWKRARLLHLSCVGLWFFTWIPPLLSRLPRRRLIITTHHSSASHITTSHHNSSQLPRRIASDSLQGTASAVEMVFIGKDNRCSYVTCPPSHDKRWPPPLSSGSSSNCSWQLGEIFLLKSNQRQLPQNHQSPLVCCHSNGRNFGRQLSEPKPPLWQADIVFRRLWWQASASSERAQWFPTGQCDRETCDVVFLGIIGKSSKLETEERFFVFPNLTGLSTLITDQL